MNALQIALVTGGSRGIGAATARWLAEHGYAVAIAYRADEAAAEATLAAVRAAGGTAVAVRADLAREGEVERMFATVDRELGRLTVLVNNAGIVAPQMRLESMSAERVGRVFAVNIQGAILCCREAVRRMSTRHGGSGGAIVNVSSAAARTGSPGEYVDYAATKGALDTLTRGLALEVAAEGIRVNGVRPGFIHTRMHADGGEPDRVERLKPSIPLGRGGTPEEIAEAIGWLASPAASYCTGAFIDCAGGR
jgi:NAD(P)-dependent dehydrogenase (short-subunit alcohol dehydrogenase family)